MLLITMKDDGGESPRSSWAPACEYQEHATKFETVRDELCGAITCSEWGRSSQLTLGKNKVVAESENARSTVTRPCDRSASKRRLNTVLLRLGRDCPPGRHRWLRKAAPRCFRRMSTS